MFPRNPESTREGRFRPTGSFQSLRFPTETAILGLVNPNEPQIPALLDWSKRRIDYLRISVTDRCNERCLYCMPQGLKDWKEHSEILTYEETLRVVRVAIRLGFRKFRVTGGEPLVRKDVVSFLEELGKLDGVDSFGLSTNATLLAPVAERLRAAGIDSVNISLDTLDPATYERVTLRPLAQALEGIEAVRRLEFPRLKLNAVLMRGQSEDQLLPLLRFAEERGAILRFIELMPVTTRTLLRPETFLSIGEARKLIEKTVPLERDPEAKLGHGPAVYYRTPSGQRIGFIGAMTDLHFCESCNKIRLTSDGKIRPCLGSHLEFDLREILRSGGTDEDVIQLFGKTLGLKPKEHEFREDYTPNRSMTGIGG